MFCSVGNVLDDVLFQWRPNKYIRPNFYEYCCDCCDCCDCSNGSKKCDKMMYFIIFYIVFRTAMALFYIFGAPLPPNLHWFDKKC